MNIGQKVVCIQPHPALIVGKIYIIQGLRETSCKCKELEVDVGVTLPMKHHWYCRPCNIYTDEIGTICWVHHSAFAPLIPLEEKSEAFIEDFVDITQNIME